MTTEDAAEARWARDRDALAGLLARTALGSRADFGELYRRTSGHLFAVILRIQRDRAQAEELLQEVYVTVWQAAGSFDAARAQPMTWLTQVARNRAIDSLRRARARPLALGSVPRAAGADADDGPDPAESVADESPSALELLASAAQARRLDDCMHGLPSPQRQSLALAFFHGLSHAEVAQRLSEPLGTVKSWVRRGLSTLRGCLDRAVLREARPVARDGS